MECLFELPAGFVRVVHEAIARHLESRGKASDCALTPDELRSTLQAALWASVMRVEGQPVEFSINLHPNAAPSHAIPLRRSVQLGAAELARLSTATLPGVSAVHVGRGERFLEILGVDTLLDDASAVRVEVRGPAALAIKAGSATIAFVYGSEAEVLDPRVYSSYLFVDSTYPVEHEADAERERRFFDIARAMHTQARGGTLLVLGSAEGGRDARELSGSLESHYELERPFDGLREIDAEEAELLRALQAASSGSEARALLLRLRAAEHAHSQYLAGVVRTTAIDGAALVSAEGALLAFGCKVLLMNTPTIRRTRPTLAASRPVALKDFGGTRHQSAARFVGRHAGTRAIVASQDRTISILNHAGPDQVECLEHAEWTF
jgi:hypothetical protein